MTDLKHPTDDGWLSTLARLAARRLDATDQTERDRAGAAILALLGTDDDAPVPRDAPAPPRRPADADGSGAAPHVPRPRRR